MRVQINKWAGIAIYLASLSGAFVVCALLSHHVAKQAVALALPYLPDEGPRQLSLVERRQIEAVRAPQALPTVAQTTEVVLTAPATPLKVMAAQLDLAEQADLSSTLQPPRPIRLTSRRVAPPVLSAGDIFGRRFGVLTVASAQPD